MYDIRNKDKGSAQAPDPKVVEQLRKEREDAIALDNSLMMMKAASQRQRREKLRQEESAAPPPPAQKTKEDEVREAADALRTRLGQDAVRYLLKHFGCERVSHVSQHDDFIRLSQLPAETPQAFALALADTVADQWSRDARAPLPDNLRVVALELVCNANVLDLDTDGRETFATLESLLRHLGTVSVHKQGEATFFGPNRYGETSRLLRVDILVKQSSLESWSGLEECFKFTGSKEDFRFFNGRCKIGENIQIEHYEILDSMGHRCSGDERSCEWRGAPSDIGFAEWAEAEAERSESELSQFVQLHNICNGDLIQILTILEQHHAKPKGPQTYLVEGLIARGVVTLMLGKKGAGKTNIALELAVDTAEQQPTWLGFPLKSNGGLVVYLYGEDSQEDVEERVRAMNGGRSPLTLRLMRYDGRKIEAIVKELGNLKVDLIVIDPARKFYEGDEDGSDAVSSFFTKIENLAHAKKAAVLVCHHLKRGSAPRDIHDVPNWMRGSQVFLDRPRTILALHRVGSKTVLGIPAPNGGDPLHNLRASIMFTGVRRLQRDEATFRHMSLDEHTKGDPNANAPERVLAALANLIDKGATMTTSSAKRELFAWTRRSWRECRVQPCERQSSG
jgi:AAA domain